MSAQKIGTPGEAQDEMQQTGSAALHELRALQDAISRSQAMIEFTLDGTIVHANDNFCAALGYTQEEVIGQHHSLFVDPEYARSSDYRQFWDRLRAGEFIRDEFRRVGKGGREVWILASYNPVRNDAGKITGVVKLATDITEEKQRRNATSGKMRALDLSMAIIEFDLDGRILSANDNFLETMGYRLDEIVGQPHAMFVDPDHAASPEYRQFWTRLRAGEFINGEFMRFGKDGQKVWIQASYNPVNGTDGRPASVIKFASDITARKEIEHKAMILAGATDNADACLMMCDADLNITYCNPAVTEMLRARQTELRTVWRDLDVDHLIGRSIDGFHTDPAHQRAILQNPDRLPFRAEISVGGLEFGLTATAVLDDKGRYVGNMVEWKDLTDKKALEREAKTALREAQTFKAAVGSASTALMFCDEDFNVSYCNDAVLKVLRPRTEELRSVWPGFDVDALIGRPIDGFHKQPEHQRRVLRDPSRLPFTAEIKVAGLEFRLVASAVYDGNGHIVGNMVEWVDITEEKAAERDIQRIIEAAGRGELADRLDPTQFSGFTKKLAGGLNELLDTVNGPVQEAVRCLGALSEGDLTAVMEGEQGGAFAELRDSYTTAVSNLTETIRGIQESAHTVSGAAAEISQGNLDLSQRTEEQSSSLEETASSMEEITSTVKQTADNAGQANQLASSARDRAEQGGTVVADAMEAMKEINAASQKIADIIGVIDEIAFQTNLLALNAAVEAARAGEQGRGFAVVASEVRNLAQRSAAEAKTIRGLIKDSVNKVGEGSRLVDQTGERLREIVEAVANVSDIVAEITAAAREQSSGIEQINQTVTQLDEMTQQNASLVEESAAAAKSLEEQASDMSGLVSSFRIDGGSLTPVRPGRPGRDDHAAPERSARRGNARAPAPARSAPPSRGRPARSASQDDGGDWSEF